MDNPSARPKRTRLPPAARHSQLLEAGVEILLDESLDRLTVERVASSAGVSRGLVFHYFPTVGELHLACMTEVAGRLFDIVAAAANHPDVDEALRRGLRSFIGYVEQRPHTFDAMSGYAGTDDRFGELFEEYRVQTATALRICRRLPDDPFVTLLLRGWVSLAETSVVRWVDEKPVPREDLIDTLIAAQNDLVSRRWPGRSAGPGKAERFSDAPGSG